MHKFKNYISSFVFLIPIIVLLLQRYFLLDISQWREDQATTYWLGQMLRFNEVSVGLISSTEIPNPNGLIWIGKFISIINDFKMSIFVFSLLQLIVLYLFIKKADLEGTKNAKYFLFLALGSSPYLVLSSFELWSQFLYITINFFLFLYLFNSEKIVSPFGLVLITFLLPSFYLAGIMNLISSLIILLVLIVIKKKSIKFSEKKLVDFALLLSIVLIIKYVWIPYFSNLDFDKIFDLASQENENANIIDLFKKIFFGYFYQEPYLIQSDLNIYSRMTLRLRTALKIFHLMLSLYFVIISVISIGLFLNNKNKKIKYENYLPGLFILVSYVVSPILGGPNFFLNERADINLQFYPLYLVFIYLLSSKLFEINVLGKLFKLVNTLSLVILFLVNSLFLGSLYQDYKSYNGNILSNSDIPLIYKIEVVDYIYQDLEKSDSINSLNIYYDLGGDGFDWIPGFGEKLTPYYEAPYTLGRVFDLLFYKKYGLKNSQEGIQFRTIENANYILTYRDFPKIDYKGLDPIEKIIDINRYRLLIMKK